MSSTASEQDITLRDGRVVHVRAAKPSDESEFLQAFERIDDAARYTRFMRSVREPNRERLRKVLASFPQAGEGIIATVPAADGFDIAGSALYFVEQEGSCEFAITVTPQFARTGLGRALMDTLIASARARGLRQMVGFVLAINEPMLALARKLGFSVRPDPDDPSVKLCRLALK
jgi:GNAT superfamily N-acetyltransferase